MGLTLGGIQHAIQHWGRDRSWIPRAPLLLAMIYLSLRHLSDPDYSSLLGGLNLGIHEAGHLLFGLLPFEFLMVLGGTVLQLSAPALSAWMFLRQPDYFAVAFCGTWLATNLYSVATYVADAREMDLPLVTVGGGEARHDWNYLLGVTHLLAWDATLAALIRVAAFLVSWASVAAGAYVLWSMARSER